MSTQEQQYITGFNHGYLLTKHLPDLVAKLVKHVKASTSEYLSGFVSGKEEWEIEHNREQLSELKNIRGRNKELGKDLENEN